MTISKYYQKNIEDIINEFETDIEKGLSIEEVKRRQEKYGKTNAMMITQEAMIKAKQTKINKYGNAGPNLSYEARKSQIKTAIRKFEEAVAAGNREEAVARFQYAQKRISQVASKGTIHKNAAARKVAKLAQKLNGMNA